MGEKKRMICYVSAARTLRGISQEKLAYSVGVSCQTIQNIEKGFNVPNVLLAIKISEKLGKNVDELFREAK
jgi:DNA-binding XRE family transcriptional regulator